MSSKDAPQKMQLLGTIKKWQVWIRGAKMQNGGKPSQNRPSPSQNRSESKFSCKFQQSVNSRGQICILVRGFMGSISFGEKFLRFQNPAMEATKIRKHWEKPFPCSNALSNKPIYFQNNSTSASIVTPYSLRETVVGSVFASFAGASNYFWWGGENMY